MPQDKRSARKAAFQKLKDSLSINKNTINKTGNNIRTPKNNVRRTPMFTSSETFQRNYNQLKNEVKVQGNRDYIARTVRAGADEFNDTPLKATKGGGTVSSGDLAKRNRRMKISKSAKGIGKGLLTSVAIEAGMRALEQAPGPVGEFVRAAREMEAERQQSVRDMAFNKGKKLGKIAKEAFGL